MLNNYIEYFDLILTFNPFPLDVTFTKYSRTVRELTLKIKFYYKLGQNYNYVYTIYLDLLYFVFYEFVEKLVLNLSLIKGEKKNFFFKSSCKNLKKN